jgi:hypothetical protein
MGLFSKQKNQREPEVSAEILQGFIVKFQKMIPDGFEHEINGKIYVSEDIRQTVDTLARVANQAGDQQLVQFIARACALTTPEFGEFSVERIAETLFDDFGVSGEIRKRYSSNAAVVEAVAALGIASILILEKNPKYPEALAYIGANADKLARR